MSLSYDEALLLRSVHAAFSSYSCTGSSLHSSTSSSSSSFSAAPFLTPSFIASALQQDAAYSAFLSSSGALLPPPLPTAEEEEEAAAAAAATAAASAGSAELQLDALLPCDFAEESGEDGLDAYERALLQFEAAGQGQEGEAEAAGLEGEGEGEGEEEDCGEDAAEERIGGQQEEALPAEERSGEKGAAEADRAASTERKRQKVEEPAPL